MASSMTQTIITTQEQSSFDQSLFWELAVFLVTVILSLALRERQQQAKAKKRVVKANPSPPRSPQLKPSIDAASRSVLQTATSVKAIFSLMEGQPSLRELNGILEMYKKLNEEPSKKILPKALEFAGKSSDSFYTVIIQVASRLGRMEMLDIILDDMVCAGFEGSLDLYENAMKLLASQKRYDLALKVYDRLEATGMEPSVVTWSCLVVFAAEVRDYKRAVRFFEKLSAATTPSVRAYMTILRVHGKRNDWPAALATFEDMREKEAPIDAPLLNLVLAVGVAVDKVEEAEKLLTETEEMLPNVPDTVSYNTLVKGYAHRNNAKSAFRTVCRLQERGLPCTAITFNTALDAAFRAAEPSVALQILSIMRKTGMRPDKFTCTILMKGLSRSPQTELIETCLDNLLDPKCHIDAPLRSRLYQCLVDASARLSAKALLKKVFAQMHRQHVSPSGQSYRILLKELGETGYNFADVSTAE